MSLASFLQLAPAGTERGPEGATSKLHADPHRHTFDGHQAYTTLKPRATSSAFRTRSSWRAPRLTATAGSVNTLRVGHSGEEKTNPGFHTHCERRSVHQFASSAAGIWGIKQQQQNARVQQPASYRVEYRVSRDSPCLGRLCVLTLTGRSTCPSQARASGCLHRPTCG